MITPENLGSHLYGWNPDDTGTFRYVEGVDYEVWTDPLPTNKARRPKPRPVFPDGACWECGRPLTSHIGPCGA